MIYENINSAWIIYVRKNIRKELELNIKYSIAITHMVEESNIKFIYINKEMRT